MLRCRRSRLIFLATLVFSLTGCALHQNGYDPPSVTITSFEAVPGKAVIPNFKIGLHIINPNRKALDLKGVAYTISVEGHKLLTGVSNKLPVIEAYGEGDVALNAAVDLFSSLRFFNDLIQNQAQKRLSYSFDAKLDVGMLYPMIKVSKKGFFTLNPKAADE